MPEIYCMEITIVLGLLLLAIIAFSTDKISVDVITMLAVILLVVTGILNVKEAFSPFGSDFIIMLASIFIVTSAIDASGILEVLSNKLLKGTTKNNASIILPIVSVTGVLSMFMNNTTVTALLINPAMAIARKSGINYSKILMPVAYASIVGGTCTLIGTSTNVAVNAYLEKNNYPVLGMFDFFALGFILFVTTLLYLWLVAPFLLKARGKNVLRDYSLREYLSEVRVLHGSSITGKTVMDNDLISHGFTILSIVRGGVTIEYSSTSIIEIDDTIIIKGDVNKLMALKDIKGIEIYSDKNKSNTQSNPFKVSEVIIPGRSELAGLTIEDANLWQRFAMKVIAIYRQNKSIISRLNDIKLEVGDMLLVLGEEGSYVNLNTHNDLVLLTRHEPKITNPKKGYLVLAAFVVAIVLGSLGIIPLAIAFVLAAVISVLIKAIKPEDAYNNIEWKLLVLIAGMTAFGTAMSKTGADLFLAEYIVDIFNRFGTLGIMAGFMLLTVLLTQPMSNAAAALVVLPIALQAAEVLNANPIAFAVAVMLSASVSLITPFEPSCILVYGPGRYRFIDFIKVGAPLTILLLILIYFGVQFMWPV